MTARHRIAVLAIASALAAPLGARAQSAGPPGGLEPTPIIRLRAMPTSVFPKGEAEEDAADVRESAQLVQERIRRLQKRDGFVVPGENLPATPRQFCVGGQCFASYKQVATALYGGTPGGDKISVFCAPRRLPGQSKFDPGDPLRGWEIDRVYCSKDWGDTLGYAPWKQGGEPASAAEDGVIPPYACFGNPHLIVRHMVLAPGGVAGQSGFVCRNRIFRLLVQKPAQSIEDQLRNIAQMCTEMRAQVWGEKYPDINSGYQKWCQSKGKDYCLPKGAAAAGMRGAPRLPFLQVSREELLFFYGHKELYCRADRPGLTHFLYNKPWAKTFTCGVARGVVEAGPFEEGVQLCAIAPYYGDRAPAAQLRDPFKARMHCWRSNRPTCEDVSRDQTKDDIHKSNVFDAYDALKEFRRTRKRGVFGLLDLKDAEKIADWSEFLSFSDAGKDEGIFGVKDFCRFIGDTKTIQCGYDKNTIAFWYQMRKMEEPAGCAGGVCQRGAYQKGYLCGLFASPEMFNGRAYWMCGLDTGASGRAHLKTARAICVGGRAAGLFHSAKGDQTTLQCYERRFRWGESQASRQTLKDALKWKDMITRAAKKVAAQPQYANAFTPQDIDALGGWAQVYGHTYGHRTSLRIGLMRSKVPAITSFAALRFKALANAAGMSPKAVADKVKSLNELVVDVASAERAPDARWWKEFWSEANEDNVLRVQATELALAKRVFAIVRVLDEARNELLMLASKYAEQVLDRAKNEGLLSRLEVHERARGDALEKGLKGTTFCIPERAVAQVVQSAKAKNKKPAAKNNFICATSALLAAGLAERVVETRKAEFKPQDGSKADDHPRQYEEFKQTLRTQVKSEWCYGSSKGGPLYGPNASAALFGLDLSSPFLMEPGRGVIDLTSAATNKRDQRKWLSASNWLKCAGFQYSDEHWQHSVPGGGRNAPGTTIAGADRPGLVVQPGVGVGSGADAVLGLVGGLVGRLIDMVVPGLGDALARVRDMSHASADFLQGWADKLIGAARKEWERGKKEIEDRKAEIETTEKDFRVLQEKLAKSIEKAGEQKLDAQKKAADLIVRNKHDEAQSLLAEAKTKAKEIVKEAEQAKNEAEKRFDKLRAEADKKLAMLKKANKMIHNSGEILGQMLEDLTNKITTRVMQTVQPKARDLLQRGFRFVRSVLGGVAKAVVAALGSIPFVGGGLAVLGQIAYDEGLNRLEEWANERLLGTVERTFAKTVRSLLSTVMKEAQHQLSKLVHSACQQLGVCTDDGEMKFGALPPDQRWLDRALACKRGPIIGPQHFRRAASARQEMLRLGDEARREAPMLARRIANEHLARFGLNLDQVIAAAKGDAAALALGRFDEVNRVLARIAKRAAARAR